MPNLYVVRTVGTADLVGIFAAADLDELRLLVEECMDPDGAEHRPMPAGGVFWPSRTASVPIADSTTYDTLLGTAQLTEGWEDALQDRGKWTGFRTARLAS